MEGVRWIIDGISVASVVMSLPVGSGVVDDTRENALENAHPGSGVLEDTRQNTLVMDGTRVKVSPFDMRGLAHSCLGMVLQRAERGVLDCSLLEDDEPVRTKRGPTP